jgi:hypothetical protein
LKDIGIDESIILEWTLNPSSQKRFSNIVYSPSVIQRLKELNLDEEELDPSFRRLTLSSRKTVLGGVTDAKRNTLSYRQSMNLQPVRTIPYLSGNHKITCTYCMMSCNNSDIQCEFCAQTRSHVWYCSIECKRDHAPQHSPSCARNKRQSTLLSVESLNQVAQSIMDSSFTQNLMSKFHASR